jgi:outer membrane cobalamin receptor
MSIRWTSRLTVCRTKNYCNSVNLYAIGALFSLFPTYTAQAQEVTPSPASKFELVLEEIIVTAQKRETAAQDVPISMTVFTDQELAALNLTNVAEIAKYTPNLEWDQVHQGSSNSASLFAGPSSSNGYDCVSGCA